MRKGRGRDGSLTLRTNSEIIAKMYRVSAPKTESRIKSLVRPEARASKPMVQFSLRALAGVWWRGSSLARNDGAWRIRPNSSVDLPEAKISP